MNKKVKILGYVGLVIIIITSGLHDWDYLKFEIKKDYYFHDWLSMFGADVGMLFWAWALKVAGYEDINFRYAMDYALDLCVVDMVFITMYNPYTFELTKLEWFAASSLILGAKIFFNKHWHWFKNQKII